MTTSVGVDIIEIHRVAAVIERWREKFLQRVYTDAELRYCRGRVPELAARFAGKEAITKALGTGIRWANRWSRCTVAPRRGRRRLA
jgi:holo-[acyl-carrier protein] synthase